MRVSVQGQADLRMPERFHDRPGVHALSKQERRGGMPQIVKPNVGDASFRQSALNAFVRLLGSKGVPMPVANTKPLSRHRGPAASRSSSCLTRCALRAATVTSGNATVRRERADFGSTRCHSFPTRCSDVRT